MREIRQFAYATSLVATESGDDKMASYVDFGIAPVRTIEKLVMKSQVSRGKSQNFTHNLNAPPPSCRHHSG